MPEPSDALRDAQRLGAQARRVVAEFLLTELSTGLALLDAIDASADRDADDRRRSLATEAYNVVTERLARAGDDTAVLTDAEREAITHGLEELRVRLDRNAKQRGRKA